MKVACVITTPLSSFALAHPSKPRTNDGYPNPAMEQLKNISRRADCTLSNAPPPPKLGESSKTAFQALAFGEEFEQAYFSSLLQNVTDGVPGYRHHGRFTKAELVKVLETVVAVSFKHSLVIHSLTLTNSKRSFTPSTRSTS